ncbi:MAG: RsmF rRNA methyltransferase first C-terminal domain-containing protein [Cytophagales bacterium]
MNKKELPKSFQNSLKENLPSHAEDLLKALEKDSPISIRLNPFKNNPDTKSLEKVPWTDKAYYLSKRPAFYADPFFHSGGYYVQEASSMIVEYILKKLQLNNEELLALDLCAAPGGKSTILSTFLKDKGLLVSNEIVWKRNLILQENLERWGQSNTIITHNNSGDFKSLNQVFDLILVDAPCSGEGMFRKDPRVIQEWSPSNVESCALRQSDILEDIASSLKNEGYLIYSTCTYNFLENESLIDEFLSQYDFECIEIDGLEDFGIVKNRHGNSIFYRLFPHKIKGEGLSICVLRKKSTAGIFPKPKSKKGQNKFSKTDLSPSIYVLKENSEISYVKRENEVFAIKSLIPEIILSQLNPLRIIKFGTHIGDFNRDKFVPSHGLALSLLLSKDVSGIELDESGALRVLQRDASQLESDNDNTEWIALKFKGNTLALAKNLKNRINIHIPKTFRIRKNIDEFL